MGHKSAAPWRYQGAPSARRNWMDRLAAMAMVFAGLGTMVLGVWLEFGTGPGLTALGVVLAILGLFFR